MCTASWLIHGQGFELFFNRDESLLRGPAQPPRVLELAGVRVLAPTDSDAGGTWLGVNEHGLALGLLNAQDLRAGCDEDARRSRGLLVRALLPAPSVAQALAALELEDLQRYRGFMLALFEPGRAPLVRHWDGEALHEPRARAPLCSSSLDGGRARTERERVFRGLQAVDGQRTSQRTRLERFQSSHAPQRGPWSPCMHRADAQTVSASQVLVEADRVALRYAAGAPCSTAFGEWLELARR